MEDEMNSPEVNRVGGWGHRDRKWRVIDATLLLGKT